MNNTHPGLPSDEDETRRQLVDEMMGPGMQEQGQGGMSNFRVDPARAFLKLQHIHANESSRWAGDLAAKDAAIDQLAEENQYLRQQIDQLNRQLEQYQTPTQNMAAPENMDKRATIDVPSNGNGPIPSIPSAESVSVPTMVVGPPNPDIPPT